MEKKEKLQTYFQDIGCDIENDIILDKCLELCSLYNLSEDNFIQTWVEFGSTTFNNIDLTLSRLLQMERTILKSGDEVITANENEESSSIVDLYGKSNQDIENEDILRVYNCDRSVVPKGKRLRSPELTAENQNEKLQAMDRVFSPSSYVVKNATPSRYSSKVERGKILLKFGKNISSWKRENNYDVRVTKFDHPSVPIDVIYMYELLRRQGATLTKVCRNTGKRLCNVWSKMDHSNVLYTKIVTKKSQTNFRTFGRVYFSVDSKTDVTSIMLEGYKRPKDGISNVVQLDISNVKQYSIFPGQIVAVEGTNFTGTTLNVNKLFTKSYANKPESPPRLTQNLYVMVAAGPFTPSDNLCYQPLFDLMECVVREEPDVLILIGPFVEYTHPEIKSASIKETFQELFERLVLKVLEYVKGKSIRVVLVASNRDAHHHPVFPTPEYDLPKDKILQDASNVHLMPDPCFIDMEGLIFGATSVDSIKHIGKEEVSNIHGMDRLTRLADHLLSQSCFYPLYPPALDLNVDTVLWGRYAFFQRQPHVLIIPSDMRYFCTISNECIVLNPERLYKYSYAKLYVPPPGKSWDPRNVSCEIAKI